MLDNPPPTRYVFTVEGASPEAIQELVNAGIRDVQTTNADLTAQAAEANKAVGAAMAMLRKLGTDDHYRVSVAGRTEKDAGGVFHAEIHATAVIVTHQSEEAVKQRQFNDLVAANLSRR